MNLLAPNAPGTRMYFGLPGSGKSFLARHDALNSGCRLVVFDTTMKDDWINLRTRFMPPNVKQWLRRDNRTMVVVADYDAYRGAWKDDRPLIVVQTADDEEKVKILEHAANQEGLGIVIHEIHSLGYQSRPMVDKVATQWRHHEQRLFIDTQRPVRVHPDVREIATQTHVFALAGPLDREACASMVTGDRAEYERAHNEVLALRARGVRGAHVALSETKEGPYVVRMPVR